MWKDKLVLQWITREEFDNSMMGSGLEIEGRVDFNTNTVYVYEGKNIGMLEQWNNWAPSVRFCNAIFVWKDNYIIKSPYSQPAPSYCAPAIRDTGACHCDSDFRCNPCLHFMLANRNVCECGSKAPVGQNHGYWCKAFKIEF